MCQKPKTMWEKYFNRQKGMNNIKFSSLATNILATYRHMLLSSLVTSSHKKQYVHIWIFEKYVYFWFAWGGRGK